MHTVLIANRGEIALRISRSCRKLGLRTVAVFSDPDQGAPHCSAADSAIGIGGQTTTESYLQIEKILGAAKQSRADAIHPGYGFLSENPAFVDAVTAAGLIFIGPSAASMRSLGHKHQARIVAQQAGVPVLPGYQGENQKRDALLQEAKKIGFPLMIKASAGGGGRGMRIVPDAQHLQEAIDAAAREAKSFFGDERLILERALAATRHIEVQVVADSFGNVVHLFERECSLQRRNQKVIEEAPAPGLPKGLRNKICDAAVAVARAGNLTSATTIEFLVPLSNPAEEFFFLEANCRIQVEHPVTEFITGLDLVELQIRVARGEKLPFDQKAVTLQGHAVEARVYAEAPALGFAPKSGIVRAVLFPDTFDGIRIDHALAPGVVVSTNYDPMLAKVIAWGDSRTAALSLLDAALSETVIFGVDNNIAFLRSLLQHPAVKQGPVATSFIGEQLPALTTHDQTAVRIVSSLWLLLQVAHHRKSTLGSPFWRQGRQFVGISTATRELTVRSGTFPLSLHSQVTLRQVLEDGVLLLDIDGHSHHVRLIETKTSSDVLHLVLEWNETLKKLVAAWGSAVQYDDSPLSVILDGHSYFVESFVSRHPGSVDSAADSDGVVVAPLPGTILAVRVKSGDKVEDGSSLASIESMKMEHSISAPCSGTVAEIFVSAGSTVKEGQRLFIVHPA